MEFRSILHEKAESGKAFSFDELTAHTAFDIVGRATFGHSLNAKSEGCAALVHWEAMVRAFAPTRQSWNFVKNFFTMRLVNAEARQLDAILVDLIRKRFDIVVREEKDLSDRKTLCIMDLILRDHMEESRQSGKPRLDPEFLRMAVTQVKTLLIAGTGTTSDGICYSMML
jgi:cytochrome P450